MEISILPIILFIIKLNILFLISALTYLSVDGSSEYDQPLSKTKTVICAVVVLLVSFCLFTDVIIWKWE